MPYAYRICLTKYADKLFASGYSNRWNSKGNLVIYAAENRSLACLENVVHRGGEGLNGQYSVLIIDIHEQVQIEQISLEELPSDWYRKASYPACQQIGDAWYNKGVSAVLKVPSSIVPKESVYVINTRHQDFLEGRIRLLAREPFRFDPRIKSDDPENMQ
ncbi:RES family NAD+ phosphorylase [Rhodocytophaga aerolata]|uniref:RES family NAD+ phosphorylase n=1 Tax=Rhodocytophaga aerolata TaxID=455078 RepID=A0ABT8RJA4_9BACT|nr:RES family NAD+ phosphorylase [Rhodocytophaga aerolata]MDO1451318.1 RES family NAD+ phosphorylase [Rhodocytophaga aerolata]